MNHAINVKNLLEFSKDYSDKVEPTMLHHVDASTNAELHKYANAATPAQGNDIRAVDNVNYNEGFAKRQKILQPSTAAALVNFIIALNRFGFFRINSP